jgi:plasmid stability protein
MSVITIRNLNPTVKRRIERRAASHGLSMEAEIRAILEDAPEPSPQSGIVAAVRNARQAMGDDVFELPERQVEYQREVGLP